MIKKKVKKIKKISLLTNDNAIAESKARTRAARSGKTHVQREAESMHAETVEGVGYKMFLKSLLALKCQ